MSVSTDIFLKFISTGACAAGAGACAAGACGTAGACIKVKFRFFFP